MLTTPPVRRAAALSRRTAIGSVAALAAAVAAGCTPRGIDRRPEPRKAASPTPDADPDVTLAATVLADEQAMVDRVRATLARYPGLGPVLAGALGAHRAHVELLTDAVPDEDRTSAASPPASPSASPTAVRTPTVPERAPGALTALAREEERLSVLGRRSTFAAESGAFARVLASMAAAASQQSVTLAAAARERR